MFSHHILPISTPAHNLGVHVFMPIPLLHRIIQRVFRSSNRLLWRSISDIEDDIRLLVIFILTPPDLDLNDSLRAAELLFVLQEQVSSA
jgi:hypothetical protein